MADFKLGRIKFKWRGDWAASTAYLVDDIVKYGANTYVVLTNHTSQSATANFYTDLSAGKYSLHTEGLYFKGNWAGSTFYKLNDLVKNGAYQYRCKLQHTSASTFAIGSNWEVYAEGLQWEDSYSSSTTYQDGDVVTYGGYTYVYVNATPASGQTPTDNSYWDVITTGFKALGAYSHGTSYKTGDTIQYGGNNYVATANHASQYPANTDGTTNTSYWTLNLEGFNYRAAYNASTTYNIGDTVRLTSSTYVAIQDRVLNVSPDSDGAKWQLIAQGDSGSVLSTRGDILIQSQSQTTRLPIGVVGSVLTTDGVDPSWSAPEGANVKYVANSGSDSNPGTQFLPYKTVYYALQQATSGDIVTFDTITGGTGGTPGTYITNQSSTDGSGVGAKLQVTSDGSSVPTAVNIVSGGSGHAVGDVVTFSGGDIGAAANLTVTVVSASIGDVVYIKNGVYKETLPIRVPAGVTVQGESLRGTEIRPKSGTGHQVKTVSITSNVSGATNGTYNYVHGSSTSGSATASTFVANIVVSGGAASSVTIYSGGAGFVVGNTITITKSLIENLPKLKYIMTSGMRNKEIDLEAAKNRNIIVTHTFSKIYGLASLRLGWCAAPERIINLLDRIRGPFNVNQIAQVAGSAALSDTNYEKKVIRHNTIWLKKFKSELAKFPLKVYDSQANFIFIKVRNATKLNKYLLSNGIIVRTLDNYEIFDCLRISIGTTLENKKFLNLIKKYFENE